MHESLDMTPLGAALAAGAALAFASLDFVRKRLADRVEHRALLFWMTVGAAPFFGVWAVIAGGLPRAAYWLPAMSSGVLNVGANLLFLRSIRVGGLSGTIPMLSFAPVLTGLAGVLVLREGLPPHTWAGVGAVVVGGLALTAPRCRRRPASLAAGGSVQGAVDGLGPPSSEALGGLLMLVVALLWSLATACDKLALASSNAAFHGLLLHSVIATSMLGLLAVDRRVGKLGDVGGAGGLIALGVLIGFGALSLQLLSLERIYAGLMETLKRGVGSVVALTLGCCLLREALTPRKLVAVALMVGGVALVLL